MAEHGHVHPTSHFVKIWGILLVLLFASLIGSELFHNVYIVLFAAFGIAIIKAAIVMKYFMHVDMESKMVWYILAGSGVLMAQFFFGTAADVMNHEGTNWENIAAKAEIARGNAAGEAAAGGHGGGHGAEAGHDAPASAGH